MQGDSSKNRKESFRVPQLVYDSQRRQRMLFRIDEILAAEESRFEFRSRQDVLYEAILGLWREYCCNASRFAVTDVASAPAVGRDAAVRGSTA
jgi:hypothetical protein